MLADLERIHENLLSCLSELELLHQEAKPDRSRLADVRWRLSRASAARTRFIDEKVYPYLLQRVSPSDAHKLKELRTQNLALRTASTAHVGRWTIEQVFDDWLGYRRASSAMAASMRNRVAAEKEILYPLLDAAENDLSRIGGR